MVYHLKFVRLMAPKRTQASAAAQGAARDAALAHCLSRSRPPNAPQRNRTGALASSVEPRQSCCPRHVSTCVRTRRLSQSGQHLPATVRRMVVPGMLVLVCTATNAVHHPRDARLFVTPAPSSVTFVHAIIFASLLLVCKVRSSNAPLHVAHSWLAL